MWRRNKRFWQLCFHAQVEYIYLYIFSLIYRRHEIIAISIVEAIFTAQININKHTAHLKSTICYAGSCATTCYAYAVYASLFLARY